MLNCHLMQLAEVINKIKIHFWKLKKLWAKNKYKKNNRTLQKL